MGGRTVIGAEPKAKFVFVNYASDADFFDEIDKKIRECQLGFWKQTTQEGKSCSIADGRSEPSFHRRAATELADDRPRWTMSGRPLSRE
jgi:hypothetical protein